MTYRKQHEYYLDYKEYNMIMTSHIPHALKVYTRHHDLVNRYEISVSFPLITYHRTFNKSNTMVDTDEARTA